MVRRLSNRYKLLKLQATALQSKIEVEFIELMREADCEDEEDNDGEKSTTSSQSTSLVQVTSAFSNAVFASTFKFKAQDRSKVACFKCKQKGHKWRKCLQKYLLIQTSMISRCNAH